MGKRHFIEIPIGKVCLIIFLVCCVILFGLWFYITMTTYSSYRVSHQVCHNTSNWVGQKYIGTVSTVYPYRVRTYDSEGNFLDSGTFEENLKRLWPDCNSTYCEYNYWEKCRDQQQISPYSGWYCYNVQTKIYKENYTKTYSNYEPIIETVVVCNQEEVESFSFNKIVTITCKDDRVEIPCSIKINNHNYATFISGKECQENCNISINKQEMKKEDLNVKWLDENCECAIKNICTDYNILCKDSCKVFRCDEYLVQVDK